LRAESIARNYAGALFALAEKSGKTVEFGEWLDALAGAVAVSPKIEAVLSSPKVTKAVKTDLLTASVRLAPREFQLFLASVVKRGRQMLLGEMAQAYLELVDAQLNRVRAGVTLARAGDAALQASIVKALEERLGKEVIATFEEDPAILGGVVVRLGDRVLDGSVRRRLTRLRRQLLR
jgi:F-type H+-transporting ATPase subunit delta